jgi:hypothetical protein
MWRDFDKFYIFFFETKQGHCGCSPWHDPCMRFQTWELLRLRLRLRLRGETQTCTVAGTASLTKALRRTGARRTRSDLLATVRARVRIITRPASTPHSSERRLRREQSTPSPSPTYSISMPATAVQRSSVKILLPTGTVLATVASFRREKIWNFVTMVCSFVFSN